MNFIKNILREEIQKGIINENFFEKESTPLSEVIECVKDLLTNLRYSLGEKHKIEFFKERLVDALEEFKHKIGTSKKILSKISELDSDYDKDIIKKLKITNLLTKVAKGKNTEKLIDDYIKSIDETIKDTYLVYKDKVKNDKNFDVINIANDGTKKITLKKFFKKKYTYQIELLKLQEWAMENKKKVLILFEGRDAAGKGSNIENFTEFLNPKGFRIETFGIPTEQEKRNWFKRYEKVLPEEGEIVLFDRSWYNRAVIEPAMGYCTKKQYNEFMDEVNTFEEKLIQDKNILLVKLWFVITKDKQKLRFELRKRDPLRYWKFSKNDENMVANWDKLTPYIDKLLEHTNTQHAPWIIINSDDKFNGILDAMRETLSVINYENKHHSLRHKDETPTKVIFLDIHGVIITKIHYLPNGDKHCDEGWDKEAIKNLNQITNETGAKFVMISSCKNNMSINDLKDNLKSAGVIGEVIGKTIPIDKHLRGEQIEDWLDNHNVTKFIVLDDVEYDTKEYYPDNLVQPNAKVGVSSSDVKQAIKKLS
jgi:polyphosphate kinase